MMQIDICICTHNPRLEILRIVISSIACQEANPEFYRVLLIDNGSSSALENDLLAPLVDRGIACRIVQEPILGLSRARIKAIEETDREWILFVDDDNELYPDFINNGIAFIQNHPDVGCFGGRLLLPKNLHPSDWVKPFLPSLGIKDVGDETLIEFSKQWGHWEPPGAGAWVHRKVLNEYLHRSKKHELLFELGRTGTRSLASADDSIMMRGAYKVGLKNAYVPSLLLYHHLNPNRFRFHYLIRLMYWYGVSHVILDILVHGWQPVPKCYKSKIRFLIIILKKVMAERKKSIPFIIGAIAYQLGVRREHFNRQNELPMSEAMYSTHPLKISIVMACRNAEKTVERTLRSIADQGYSNLEFIVVDGLSTDRTLEIVRLYNHIISQLICEKDRNVCEAINKGFKLATGDILCYLNADDCFLPGALHRIAKEFHASPEIDVITGGCKRVFADGSIVITQVPVNFEHLMPLRNVIEQPSTFWRASIHQRTGELDESYSLAFDWDWWNRLYISGAKFKVVDDILSVYYFSESNLTSNAGMRAAEESYRITKSYGPCRGILADVYRILFRYFDLKGYYDHQFSELGAARRVYFGFVLCIFNTIFGRENISAYNWQWASRQIRGLPWYK